MKRLRRAWTRVRAIHGLGRDLSILAGVLVLGLGVGGYTLVHQRVIWPWDHRVTYVAEFAEAPAVSAGQGQEVRIAGMAVGDIVKTAVSDEGRALVTLSLRKQHGAVYDNATAVLRPKSPLNEMYVLLDPGGPPGHRLRPGARIPYGQTARPIQIDEVLGHLDEKSRQAFGVLLTEADAALVRPQELADGFRGADATMTALGPVAEALKTRREKIATLVTALSDIASASGKDDARLAGLVDSARTTLDMLARHDGDFDKTLAALPGFTDDLGSAAGSLSGLAAELDPALAQLRGASEVLPGALSGLTGVVGRLDTTIALARPVVAGARPLVTDLRPFVGSASAALTDASAVTPRFDPLTANIVGHLGDIAGFVYDANSLFSVEDANGPLLRGLVTVGFESDPSGFHYPTASRVRP
jgi:phospholipid/cholesterol/gamma-HCH transport system substrate-binding protein